MQISFTVTSWSTAIERSQVGNIEVNNDLYIWDIESTGKHGSGHKNFEGSITECSNCFISNVGFSISINKVASAVIFVQNSLNCLCKLLGVHKDNALRCSEFLKHFDQEINLLAVATLELKLFYVRQLERLGLDSNKLKSSK